MALLLLVPPLLKLSIVLTVFAHGLGVRREDALYLLRHPGRLGASILAMYVLAPFAALVIALVADVPVAVKVALVTLALSPVSPLLPGRQSAAWGSGPYAAALFVCSALLAVLTVPIGVELLGLSRLDPLRVPASAVAGTVLGTVLLPLLGGLAVRTFLPRVARKIADPLCRLASIVLVAGGALLLVAAWPAAGSLVADGTLLALAAFAAAALATGHLLGGDRTHDQIVLALSTTARHPALAVSVAALVAPGQQHAAAAVLLYLLVAMAGASVYARHVTRTHAPLVAPLHPT